MRLQHTRALKESIDVLGAASFSSDCILLASLMMWSGGLAQNTRQFLGSVKPGSMLGFSSLSRKGSIRTSLKSDDRNFSFCCPFLVTRCVEYSDCISACMIS